MQDHPCSCPSSGQSFPMPRLQYPCALTHSLFQAFLCILVFSFTQFLSAAFEECVLIASPFSPCLAEGRALISFFRTRISIHPSMIWVLRNVICQRVFFLQNSVFLCANLLHVNASSMPVLPLLSSLLLPFQVTNFCLFILILLSHSQSVHVVLEFKHHFEQLLTLKPEQNSSFTDQFSVFCPQSIK